MMMSVSRHERGRMAMDQMVWGESNLKQQMSAEGSLRGPKEPGGVWGRERDWFFVMTGVQLFKRDKKKRRRCCWIRNQAAAVNRGRGHEERQRQRLAGSTSVALINRCRQLCALAT